MTGMTLVEFLRARLDEDEQVARGATSGPWRWELGLGAYEGEPDGPGDWGHMGPDLMSGDDDVISSRGYDGDNVIVKRADAEHIARHDPARVLADVAAKRRQIDHTFRYEAKIDGEWGCCHSAESIARGDCLATPVDEIEMLRLLALPYAEHPDYREEWRSGCDPVSAPPLECVVDGWVTDSAEVSGPRVEVGTSVMRVRGVDGEVVLDLSGPGEAVLNLDGPALHVCSCTPRMRQRGQRCEGCDVENQGPPVS